MTRSKGPPPPPSEDPYRALGLDRRAPDADVKRAYYEKVRDHPPERDPDAFQRIRSAYERLRTPEARARTDLFLVQPPDELPRRRMPAPDVDPHAEDVVALAAARLLAHLARKDGFRVPEGAPGGSS